MRFLTFDELTPSMDADRLLVHLSALGGATDRRSVAVWRRRSNIFAEYVGVFAVDGGRVVGQTLVKRLAYTFPGGTEIIGAIASVGTRPDRARGGVARQILAEVHRREREAGIRYVSLWTNRSWGAHRLYEKLGYRDVYAYPWAVRPPAAARTRRPAAGRTVPAQWGDLAELERLHDRAAEGRVGFCRRPSRYLRTSAETRDLTPATELIVYRPGERITGYAYVQSTPIRTVCGELVAESTAARTELVRAIERRAAGTTVAFQHTPVTDSRDLLRRRGYATMGAGWYVFMGHSLERKWTARSAVTQFASEDRRFLSLVGDRF